MQLAHVESGHVMSLIMPSNGVVIQRGLVGYLLYMKTTQCLLLTCVLNVKQALRRPSCKPFMVS